MTDAELRSAKLDIIEKIQDSKHTIAGAIVEEQGIRGFCIGGGSAEQTALMAHALRKIADDINTNLLRDLGEGMFERLQVHLAKAQEVILSDRHESRGK